MQGSRVPAGGGSVWHCMSSQAEQTRGSWLRVDASSALSTLTSYLKTVFLARSLAYAGLKGSKITDQARACLTAV
jgi:hypothetical protein